MKKILCAGICCVFAVLLLWCSRYTGENNELLPVVSMDTAMGTVVNQAIYVADGKEVAKDVLELIAGLEQKDISWRLETAEIYRMNQSAGAEDVISLSPKMAAIVETCFEISRKSEGAFDITVGPLARLWDIDTWAGSEGEELSAYHLPTETEIAERLELVGYEKVELDDNGIRLPEQMRLDLGAVGKGIALDEIRKYLKQKDNVVPAVISVGGSVVTYGSKPDGNPWRVGIVNPLNSSENIGYLELEGEWCVSTSGDYERYVEIDGVRYHHIIDPKTGYPADSGVRGVTILSKDGLLSDAMSTACFILGKEKGFVLAETMGVEALFVGTDGELSMTDGMKTYFHLSKSQK